MTESIQHYDADWLNAANRATSASEVSAFLSGAVDRYCAYLSSDCKSITTWIGDVLAVITSTGKPQRKRTSFLSTHLTPYQARGIDGRMWYGRHNGGCIYTRMRVLTGKRSTSAYDSNLLLAIRTELATAVAIDDYGGLEYSDAMAILSGWRKQRANSLVLATAPSVVGEIVRHLIAVERCQQANHARAD